MAAANYCVLLAKPENLKHAELAGALAAFKKIPLHEAARLARGAWGFAGENLEENEARDLCARLQEAGLEGVVAAKNSAQELPEALALTRAELNDEGFRAILKSGENEWISWNQLALLAAAGFETITETTTNIKEGPTLAQKAVNMGFLMATGLPISIAGKKREAAHTERREKKVFYLDLYLRKPLKRWRLDAQDFNYACLKERLAYNAFANFKTLLLEWTRQAPQAVKNKGVRVLAEGGSVTAMGYAGIADLEKESRWLLALENLKNP